MSSSCQKCLICKLLEDGKVHQGSQCLLHSHILSQVLTFTVGGDKILDLKHLWYNKMDSSLI